METSGATVLAYLMYSFTNPSNVLIFLSARYVFKKGLNMKSSKYLSYSTGRDFHALFGVKSSRKSDG